MGLERPLSSGKSKIQKRQANRKPTKAEREQAKAWEELQAKWASVPKLARQDHATPKGKAKKETYRAPKVATRITPHHPSLVEMGTAPLKESPKYTGTKILGVATMHKSSAVPVFSEQEAVEISRMRRG